VTQDISTVGIVGCGTMGSGIAQIVASNGFEVVFVEQDDAAVEAGTARITANLDRLVQRGRIEQDERDATLARIRGAADYAVLADADLIVEAVPEVLELKQGRSAASTRSPARTRSSRPTPRRCR